MVDEGIQVKLPQANATSPQTEKEITIYVDGIESVNIHTSCSNPIGIGSVFGDFTVLDGASKDGGQLCPIEVPEVPPEGCAECKGEITNLTLQYNGAPGNVVVYEGKDDSPDKILFSGYLNT